MSKYADIEQIKKVIRDEWVKYIPMEFDMNISFVLGKIAEVPTIDIVRCKDCKYKVVTDDGEYNPQDIVCSYWASDGLEEEDFCSYGEQTESEE